VGEDVDLLKVAEGDGGEGTAIDKKGAMSQLIINAESA